MAIIYWWITEQQRRTTDGEDSMYDRYTKGKI